MKFNKKDDLTKQRELELNIKINSMTKGQLAVFKSMIMSSVNAKETYQKKKTK